MKRPDEQVLQSMVQLKVAPYGKRFLQWIEESLAEQREGNDTLEGVELSRGQGRAQQLDEIWKQVDGAAKQLEQILQGHAKHVQKRET